MRFTIYDDSTSGTAFRTETQPSVVVEKGLFSVFLGSLNPIPDTIFTGDLRYLAIRVGSDAEMSPRRAIVSMAYAFRSLAADTARYAHAGPGVADNDWSLRITDGADTTLLTGGEWGISRYGNVLYGSADSTHVNLGVACTTGMSGSNYKYGTLGGGKENAAGGEGATVAGGGNNKAYHDYAAIGGGVINVASGSRALVGGGFSNAATGEYATLGGGWNQEASGDYSSVGGGRYNSASGQLATVPGGFADTTAGDFSLACGSLVRLTPTADYTFAFGNGFTTSTPCAVIFYHTVSETKVGIQTTDPIARLDVNSSTGYNQIRMRTSYTLPEQVTLMEMLETWPGTMITST